MAGLFTGPEECTTPLINGFDDSLRDVEGRHVIEGQSAENRSAESETPGPIKERNLQKYFDYSKKLKHSTSIMNPHIYLHVKVESNKKNSCTNFIECICTKRQKPKNFVL
jgi:hypothetical protein